MTVLGALQVDAAGPSRQLDDPRQDGAGHGRRYGPRHRGEARRRRDAAHGQGPAEDRQACTLPLTSARPVDLVVSELAVIGFPDGRATLLETAPGVTVEQVRAARKRSCVSGRLSTMAISERPAALVRGADAVRHGGGICSHVRDPARAKGLWTSPEAGAGERAADDREECRAAGGPRSGASSPVSCRSAIAFGRQCSARSRWRQRQSSDVMVREVITVDAGQTFADCLRLMHPARRPPPAGSRRWQGGCRGLSS